MEPWPSRSPRGAGLSQAGLSGGHESSSSPWGPVSLPCELASTAMMRAAPWLDRGASREGGLSAAVPGPGVVELRAGTGAGASGARDVLRVSPASPTTQPSEPWRVRGASCLRARCRVTVAIPAAAASARSPAAGTSPGLALRHSASHATAWPSREARVKSERPGR